jgi:hypothetical protein
MGVFIIIFFGIINLKKIKEKGAYMRGDPDNLSLFKTGLCQDPCCAGGWCRLT